MRLETERLTLREMTEDDFAALNKVLGDTDNMRFYPYVFDENRVRDWISRNIERYRTFGFGLWSVCLKDTGELIGDCGLTMQNINGVIRPEIGYHIRADRQRNGYAREAAEAVRDWTFSSLPFGRIYSYMTSDNIPSSKTAESWGCSFVEEYKEDDGSANRVYMITREEWEVLKA